MGNEIEKFKECYNFLGPFNFFKKYNFGAAKLQHDHHGRRHKNHKSSNNNYKTTHPHTLHDEHIFKAKQGMNQDASDLQELKKVSQSGKEANKMRKKHNSNNGCFKALFLIGAPKNKKSSTARISSFEPPKTQFEGLESNLPPKAKSFNTIPSFGRSSSINEQETKTPNNSRIPSLNRTTSSNRTTINRNANISLNRSTTSIGRSTPTVKFQKTNNNMSKSGPIIMFSTSTGMLRPPSLEEQLECTLEELCLGCVKRIKVPRRVYTSTGHVMQEDEILTVNIKPGWKTGTKITFQGTVNDERPGEIPGDIIFIITEKHHPLFRRFDDDLEVEIKVPLVDALTGCNLTIPLLGKDNMSLEINEIIHPGHEKIIAGQGMPNQKSPNQRGNLKVKLLVGYPNNLTDEQRSEISRILCY